MIEIKNLVKYYGKEKVLDINTFFFYDSICYLLIGENGAGKSTLIKLILGLIKVSKGKITNDYNKISYIPERFYFPSYLTIYQFLENIAKIKAIKNHLEKIKALTSYWEIDENKRIDQLSKGMRQKVLIIQAILEEADLYIFDEPLNGLDIHSQNEFLKLVKELVVKKKTIIISTHYDRYYNDIGVKRIYLKAGKIEDEEK